MQDYFHPTFTITMQDGSVMKGELYPEYAPQSVGNFVSLAINAVSPIWQSE